MPRIEKEIMTKWEFTLNEPKDENFYEVTLPHDWAITASINKNMEYGGEQGFRERWGVGWYRKVIHVETVKRGYKYYLDFGGIFENSTIWINGQMAGGYKYGYSSFRVEITSYLVRGNNHILIKVDNTMKPADRWYSGAGIYRTVKWLELEDRHFTEENIVVKTSIIGEEARIIIDTGLVASVKATFSDTKNCYEKASEDGKVEFTINKPKLWSAETPNLYTLILELLEDGHVCDRISIKVGIREISMIPNQGMYINGEKIKLKGVCIHQDVGCRGIAAKQEVWRERLIILKEMGCNAIRAAHHIYSREFLDLCDELGFYVYEECFDKWTGGLYGRYFETEWKKDLECMIKRDRNHPCIFIWGVGNEVENQAHDSMLAILKMLKENILRLDDTRPITYAMNPHFKRESSIDISKVMDIQKFVDEANNTEIYCVEEKIKRIKRIADIVDVISCNYQEQWYEQIHKEIPDKLILGTEVYQYFKGHPEQMQNFSNENPFLEVFQKEYVIGGMIWTGFDYLGESMGYPAKGWSGACIRTNGERRPSSYIIQSYWDDKPMVHFAVMDYSLQDEGVKEHWDAPIYATHWHFPQFHKVVIPYIIASNCEKVELYLNEKQIYVAKSFQCPNGVITGFLPYIPGTVKVIGYRGGKAVCSHHVKTPGPAVKLEFDKKEISINTEKSYEIMLTLRAKDELGSHYFRESALVRFKIEGDAEIIGVDNGNLMGNEPYDEEFIHMYHGCASVMVRLSGKPGKVVVYGYAEGMQSASAVINVYS